METLRYLTKITTVEADRVRYDCHVQLVATKRNWRAVPNLNLAKEVELVVPEAVYRLALRYIKLLSLNWQEVDVEINETL